MQIHCCFRRLLGTDTVPAPFSSPWIPVCVCLRISFMQMSMLNEQRRMVCAQAILVKT